MKNVSARKRTTRAVPILLAAMMLAALGSVQAQDAKESTRAALPPITDFSLLPESARQQILALAADKEARTPAQRKIGSSLLYMAKQERGIALTKGALALQPIVPPREDGRVDVEISGSITKPLIEAIQGAGGDVLFTGKAWTTLRAIVPLDALENLAERGDVRHIRATIPAMTHRALAERVRPQLRSAIERLRPKTEDELAVLALSSAGAAVSQGDKAHRADEARRFFGLTGAGVKIGVLSDSDDFKEQSISTGDLPADTVTVPGQDGRPGAGEGTAMMEIVHDLAPGAKLFFATAFNSPESFADNIRTLRFTYGCDIIVDDVIYFFESPFQDVGGTIGIAKAVEDVTADGALYFSSAGNEGNFNDGTSGTWEGDFKASHAVLPALPAGYDVHDFGKGVISDRIELSGGPLTLHWSDEFFSSANDYDLFVLTPDLSAVAVASTDIQDGTGNPFEFLGFFIPSEFRVVILKKLGAQDRALHTVLFGGELALATSGATFGHDSVTDAFDVAAVDVFQAGGGAFTGGPATQVELFSSDGFRRIFYDSSGNPIGSGLTFKSGGGEQRKKPDLAAADGVSTTLPPGSGLNPFFGTSAAAPHAAAIAGLLKSAKPLATPTKLRNALTKTAIDIEAVGRDRDSGFGIVDAFAALSFIGATPAPFLELGARTVTPTTGDGDAFLEPGESASLLTQLVNTGGAAPVNLQGVLTTSTAGVTISNGTSTFPAIPPGGGTGVNNTPYTFSLSPAVACGVAPKFNLTASYSNGALSPQSFDFSVQTGAPDPVATTTSFTGPPTPIPDANPVGVNIPITVSGLGAVSRIRFSLDGTVCTAAAGATTVGLDHTWVGDLVMTLTSPSGTTVTLANRPGGAGNSGNNFCQTVLDDLGATSIQNVTIAQAPFTGTFKPASPLAAFNGEPANGTWVLNVSDNAFIDIGSVRAFSLIINGFTCN